MKSIVSLACLFLLVEPAAAACHHYRKWMYPWPQQCGAAFALQHRAPAVDRSWYVEIARMPPDVSRLVAIETLKVELLQQRKDNEH